MPGNFPGRWLARPQCGREGRAGRQQRAQHFVHGTQMAHLADRNAHQLRVRDADVLGQRVGQPRGSRNEYAAVRYCCDQRQLHASRVAQEPLQFGGRGKRVVGNRTHDEGPDDLAPADDEIQRLPRGVDLEVLHLDRAGIGRGRRRRRIGADRAILPFPRHGQIPRRRVRRRRRQRRLRDIGMVRGPVVAAAIAEIVGPWAAQRLRQLAGKKNAGERAVVVEIAVAVALKLHRGGAGTAQIEHHGGAFGEHSNCGPRVGRTAPRPRARRIQRRDIERERAEHSERAGQARHAPVASGGDVRRQPPVQRESGARQVSGLRGGARRGQVDADDADPVVVDVHLKKRKEAPLEIAQVAFEAGEAVSHPGLEPGRNRVAGDVRRPAVGAARRSAATLRGISFTFGILLMRAAPRRERGARRNIRDRSSIRSQ